MPVILILCGRKRFLRILIIFDSHTHEWTPIIPFFFKKFGDNKANVKTGEEWYISTIREYPEWHTKGGLVK